MKADFKIFEGFV